VLKPRVLKRLLTLAISCGFFIVCWIGNALRRLTNGESDGTCAVLYYHGIASADRVRFARQLDTLLRCTKPVRADFTIPLPQNSRNVSVTFDDGLVSFAENALPELEKRNIPSTLFVVSGRLGQRPDWANYSDEPLTTERTLNSTQLREISERVLIGSHTVTHPMLTGLNEVDAKRELTESRMALEQILERQVTVLSFPYGAFDNCLLEWSREAGYERVFTTLPLPVQSKTHVFAVGRVSTEPSDWPLEFRLKVLGAYQWLPLAFATKRRVGLLFNGKRKNIR
jgi:peptidoglycan/xylan/chitin deacetylase (PgdA/CDA1 family)